jgi:hypothetical protein
MSDAMAAMITSRNSALSVRKLNHNHNGLLLTMLSQLGKWRNSGRWDAPFITLEYLNQRRNSGPDCIKKFAF